MRCSPVINLFDLQPLMSISTAVPHQLIVTYLYHRRRSIFHISRILRSITNLRTQHGLVTVMVLAPGTGMTWLLSAYGILSRRNSAILMNMKAIGSLRPTMPHAGKQPGQNYEFLQRLHRGPFLSQPDASRSIFCPHWITFSIVSRTLTA